MTIYMSEDHILLAALDAPIEICPECIPLMLPFTSSSSGTSPMEIHAVDPNDEKAMRHYIQKFTVPFYGDAGVKLKTHLKNALQWLLNGGYEAAFPGNNGYEIMANDPDRRLPLPDDLKKFYIWIWKEISGENVPWEIPSFSPARYVIIDYDAFLESLKH
jgi:hypothetical protein